MQTINKPLSVKKIFTYLVFAFIFCTALFTRSFIGLSILGFRIGELLIGVGLTTALYFLFFGKPEAIFKFEESKITILYKAIIILFLIRSFSDFRNIDLYLFKSSSTIWTISFIFIGLFVSSISDNDVLIKLGFLLLPFTVYIFQTGNYPNFIIDFFIEYSDKFQFMKAADMVLIIIISTLFFFLYTENKVFALYFANLTSFLFLPLIAINSRGAVLGLFLFIIFYNFFEKKLLKDMSWKVIWFVLLNVVVFSYSSLRVSNIGADRSSPESVGISDLPKVVSNIADEKSTQDVFLSFYFSEGRIFSTDPTTNWRLDIWQDVISDLNNKNLMIYGYGYESIIPVMTDPSAPGRLGRDGLNEHVHNFFMTTFARGGILNFILFVYFYYQILQKLKSSNLKQHTYTLLVPCLVMSSLDITMDGVQFPMLYYFFIGYFLQKQD